MGRPAQGAAARHGSCDAVHVVAAGPAGGGGPGGGRGRVTCAQGAEVVHSLGHDVAKQAHHDAARVLAIDVDVKVDLRVGADTRSARHEA